MNEEYERNGDKVDLTLIKREPMLKTEVVCYGTLMMVVAQVIGLLSFIPFLDFLDSGATGLSFAGYIFDLIYLHRKGIKGHWKWLGCIFVPAYLFVRAKKLNEKKTLAILSTTILIFSLLLGSFISTKAEEKKQSMDEQYISCAQSLIEKSLKDPSSARYNESYVFEKDAYGRAIVYLDLTARNGFGGVTRDRRYVCIKEVKKDGTFTYHPYFYSCSVQNNKAETDFMLSSLKSQNDFGEPK